MFSVVSARFYWPIFFHSFISMIFMMMMMMMIIIIITVLMLLLFYFSLFCSASTEFALVTRQPYCSGGPKKLCFTTLSLIPIDSIARLSVVKQSSFGLPGQYCRRVTRVNVFQCYWCPCGCCAILICLTLHWGRGLWILLAMGGLPSCRGWLVLGT